MSPSTDGGKMATTRRAITVQLSSPLVIPKKKTYPVYAGKRILNTKAGDIDSSQLYEGLNEIEAIVGVTIGHDGTSIVLDLLIEHINSTQGFAAFIAATSALLRDCAASGSSQLFPELGNDDDLVISFNRQ